MILSPLFASDPADGPKVLMVTMPWAPPDFPGLGPALIRSILLRDGIPCDILYANLIFSRLLRSDPFIDRELPKLPMCELAFSPYYFEKSKNEAVDELHSAILELAADPSAMTRESVVDIVDRAGECLDIVFDGVRWEDYDIVAFATMMQQSVASLALAKRLKDRYPKIRTLFGGANTTRPMGLEMMERFPEIDFMLEGEVDGTITQFVEQYREQGCGSFDLPGLHYRDERGRVKDGGPGGQFYNLDSLPYPDFLPFLEQLERQELYEIEPTIPFETSRGCWWGAKHHCTFCGLHDDQLKYRTKSVERVIDEILTLARRYQRTEFFAVDSIINHKAFQDLLPVLNRLRETEGYDFTFFFETKSNLKRENAQIFRNGGVTYVQPGVESFGDHVLKLMDKGTTGARSIQCLKVLGESDIFVAWNLLYGFPGETEDDYVELLEAIPFLHHFLPLHEGGLTPVQLNRYAPYHNVPDKYGITDIHPKDHYGKVFASPDIDHDRLAFAFDYAHQGSSNERLKELQLELWKAIANWRDVYVPDSLLQRRGPGFVEITDKRTLTVSALGGAPDAVVTILEAPWADVFSYLDEVHTEAQVLREFERSIPLADLSAFLDRMVCARLIYRSPSRELLTLPLLLESRCHQPREVRIPDKIEVNGVRARARSSFAA
ncbi:RiPP maturation radical SAM protein 1 [Sphingomonas sp. CGMCC 1.13654]|uniref:RiPP maturation radical SAM protein 1 n=1 Tax=Sphingomonas chungangi TaxID=2683589 RepID=A0A838L8Z0_9SPHN|nr:RiPP maturation radical SAM C-methyltransferase [Sphingomonas chungangi]MBA2935165.1 RiPP maturation radical SAM protein 1 [Sphingomonas chungangi]MVW57729.1 RiPP maturation radical SAM protein 1 [Sphingomonas chungangi]